MGLDFDPAVGQTPLNEDEREGLLIPTVTTRGELDEFEQHRIQQALRWMAGRVLRKETILTESFARRVHKKMFEGVWAWAGEFRRSNKNIGIDKLQIPVALRNLLDDCGYWIDHSTYSPDEIAVRFKHRLVQIHCFSNGNGRHSLLMADAITSHIFRLPVYTWGANADLVHPGSARELYLAAIRAADNGELRPLIALARS